MLVTFEQDANIFVIILEEGSDGLQGRDAQKPLARRCGDFFPRPRGSAEMKVFVNVMNERIEIPVGPGNQHIRSEPRLGALG